MKYSQRIADFLDFIKQSEQEYNLAQQELEFLAKEKIDLDHEMEFAPNRRESNKIAWKEHQNLIDRRYNKDKILMLESVITLVTQDKKTFDRLRQVLGEVRKNENYTGSERKYYSRVAQYYGKGEK